jgi:hypothetical protein
MKNRMLRVYPVTTDQVNTNQRIHRVVLAVEYGQSVNL